MATVGSRLHWACRRFWRAQLALSVVVVAELAGCAGGPATYQVTGTVRRSSGEPLSGGRVLFHPAGDGGESAWGLIAEDGTFELRTLEASLGAAPGTYKVVINPPVPDDALDDAVAVARYRSVVDGRYQSVEETPLEFTVTNDGTANHFDIVLTP